MISFFNWIVIMDVQDLAVWIEKYLPPASNFGAFIDVYGLLARFVKRTGKGHGG